MLRKIFRQWYKFGNCAPYHIGRNKPFIFPPSCRFRLQNTCHNDSRSELENKNVTDSNDSKIRLHLKSYTSVLEPASQDISSTIKSFKTVEDVLDFLRTNSNIDVSFLASIFHAIFFLQKSGCSKLSIKELKCRKEVEYLSAQVKKKVRFLNVDDAIDILKTLMFLEVPSNSILSQHLLQMISQNVNRLTVVKIIFFQFLLRKCASNPLVDALIIALPIIFETNIRFQLDREDATAVSEALRFVANEPTVSSNSSDFLVETALQMRDKFNCEHAYLALTSIFDLKSRSSSQLDLYKHLMKIVVENMNDNLNAKQINYLIRRSIDMFIHVDVNYYSEELISKATDYMITREVEIEEIAKLLRNCDRISYPSYKIIDYVDNVFVKLDTFDDLSSSKPVLTFLANCSNLMYKPKYWDVYEAKMVEYIEKHKAEHLPLLVKAVTDLIVMKCWPSSLIEICFSEEYIRDNLEKVNQNLNYIAWLTMYQAVQSLYPGRYAQNLPSENIVKKAISIFGNTNFCRDFPVQGALAHAFGGHKHVLTGVRTRLGHFIDHLMVKRKNGQMYVINEKENKAASQELIEYLDIPEESLIMAVLVLNPAAYCLDGLKMRGKSKLVLHSMEALGILTIPISKYAWINLPDRDKIPYLINKIESRTPAVVSHVESRPKRAV